MVKQSIRHSELVSYYDYNNIIITFRAGLLKAGLRSPRNSADCDFRYESLKSKFILILRVYNLMIRLLNKTKRHPD